MRFLSVGAAAALVLASLAVGSQATAQPDDPAVRKHVTTSYLSAGGKAWAGSASAVRAPQVSTARRLATGTNVNANDPAHDLAAGQNQTAIAAAKATVVTAWNDATGLLVAPSTDLRASMTGVAISRDRGRTFRDLLGLPNPNANQKWYGDPTVVAIDSHHFAIGSIYSPSGTYTCAQAPARVALAVVILTIGASGDVSFGDPVITAQGADYCLLGTGEPDGDSLNAAFLDKEWLSYNKASRTLAMSYTRLFFGYDGQSGDGQVELVRAQVPEDPATLSATDWSKPVVVWPEEATVVNQGAYVSVASNGDAYVSWERNVSSNTSNGDPYVYIHVARVKPDDTTPDLGGPDHPRVVTTGQVNSNGRGGVKSLDTAAIAGYFRTGGGQDYPRIAVDTKLKKVIVVWNDGSAHPLGDIWMRALPLNLKIAGSIRRVNDDDSYALHFMPAVSIRSNGSVATSWYDRRIGGANSTRTDYYGEVRRTPGRSARDFRVTSASTDWLRTSSYVTPNFGDYTDNASTGNTTYYAWTDGRIGVPQPFVDHHH